VELELHVFLATARDGGEWSASYSGSFNPGENKERKRLRRKMSCPCREKDLGHKILRVVSLLIYLFEILTHSLTELSPSREAANCAATQELLSIL
jgi:hypothetical protein